VVAALGAALAVGADAPMRAGVRPFPSVAQLPSTPLSLQDVALTSAGLRAAAADLAWVQLLQYTAGGLPGVPDQPGHPFEHILAMTQRVVRLDPSFHRAYLYGAGILGWFHGVDRPDEAVDLLREGVRRDPGQRLYALDIAALAYQKKGDVDKTVGILEAMVDDPDAPALLKPILANLYRKRGDYGKAIALWELVLDDENVASEHQRAITQIAELKTLIKTKPSR
jgi:tetratricopeptide (TPR) repeat protein